MLSTLYSDPTKTTPQTDLQPVASEHHRQVRAEWIRTWFRGPIDLDNYTQEDQQKRDEYRTLMLKEPAVATAFWSLIASVMSLPPIVHPDDPDNPKSVELAKAVKSWVFDSIEGGAPTVIRNIAAGGLIDGFSVNEMVIDYPERGVWRQNRKLVLTDLAPLDSKYLRFDIDQFKRVQTVRGMRANAGQAFPAEQFVIFTHQSLFGSPMGISRFRGAYRAALVIESAIKLRAILLQNYTGPFLQYKSESGTSRETAMSIMAEARAMGFVVCNEGDEVIVTNLAASADSEFQSAIDDLRKEIYTAIRWGYLPFTEAAAGAKVGNTSVQRSITQLGEWMLATDIASVINTQIIKPLVRANVADEDVGFPRLSLGGRELEETKAQAEIFKTAQSMGVELSKRQVQRALDLEEPTDQQDTLRDPSQQQPGMGGMMPGMGGPGGPPGGQQPAPNGPPPPQGGQPGQPGQQPSQGGIQPSELDHAAMLAIVDLRAKAAAEGRPFAYRGAIRALRGLIGNHDQMMGILAGQPKQFAWMPGRTSAGKLRADGTGEHQGQHRYGKDAERLLKGHQDTGKVQEEGQQRHKQVQDAKQGAKAVAYKVVMGTATVDDYKALADHIEHLNVDELRSLRVRIGARFNGESKREGMVRSLTEWALKSSRGEPTEPEREVKPRGYNPAKRAAAQEAVTQALANKGQPLPPEARAALLAHLPHLSRDHLRDIIDDHTPIGGGGVGLTRDQLHGHVMDAIEGRKGGQAPLSTPAVSAVAPEMPPAVPATPTPVTPPSPPPAAKPTDVRANVFTKPTDAPVTSDTSSTADLYTKANTPGGWAAFVDHANKGTTPRDELIKLAKDQAKAKKLPKGKILDLLKAEQGESNTPAKPVQEGPKEGDKDANGLVFRKGRWHRDEEPGITDGDTGNTIAPVDQTGVQNADVAATSPGGDQGGVSAGQPVGGDAQPTPGPNKPRTRQGTRAKPDGVPANAGSSVDGTTQPAGGSGNGPTGGAGTGDGGTPAPRTGRNRPSQPAVNPEQQGNVEPPTPDTPADANAGNFRYTSNDFVARGAKAKFQDNITAIKTLQQMKAEGREQATPEEQAIISKWVGWGQFPAVFNTYGVHGGENAHDWRREREQLQNLLSPEEWESARRSTLNAHYTHPDVVKAHWQMAEKLGYKGGRFLETSAGIGYYLGMMPEHLADKTRSSAVEMDNVTGNMLKALYPAANVKVQGFQDHLSPDNFYDLVASNVPFGDYKVHDPKYNKHQANIHDYFFLKSLDKVKPGGLVMHITSTGTLDKSDPAIRQEMAKSADLVAAIRFPGSAHKANAGTEVVTDMLIFRKKHPGEEPVDPVETPKEAQPKQPGFTGTTVDSLGRLYHWVNGKRVPGPDWTATTTVPDPAGGEPIEVNSYFAAHPEQILGTLDRTGTMYRGNSVNVSKTDDYEQRLQAAIDRLPEGVFTANRRQPNANRPAPAQLPAPNEVKDGGYVVQGGKLYVREGGAMTEQKADKKTLERVEGQLKIRDAMRDVLQKQLDGQDSTQARANLNAVYDAYVKKNGALNDRANKSLMRTDPDSPVLLALEKYDPETKKATKADIFAKDTIAANKPRQTANDVTEALSASLHEHGNLDIGHMAKLLGRTSEDVGRELTEKGLGFYDPSEGWKPADQYLSGNVRRKLTQAKAAAEADPRFQPNVEALEKVQPEDVHYEDIDVKLGASWVPASDVKAFAASLIGAQSHHLDINYAPNSGQWMADFTKQGKWVANSQQATEVWATRRTDFMQILDAALNGTTITIYDKDSDGTSHVNRVDSDDANAKVNEMREAFKGWVWDNDERRERLHRYYNDNFNNIRNIQYDGSHQTFPGKNPSIDLRDHQKNFVWQVVTTGKGLAAHEVGTGKTFSMIASAMELRRLGLAKKPAIACLKANVESITNDALKLYPAARILSTADMFDAQSRKKTISRIATGDYDMVILTHDHLDLLQMKPEVVQNYIREELKELEAAIVQAQEDNPKKGNRIVKQLEKSKQKLEARLKDAIEGSKKDDAVYFEETGIDHLFVDEAHKYKSLPVYTKRQGLKGVPNSRSDRATNMQMRTRWLAENNGGRGVVFATGTPIANTMAELYTMQRYLQPQELKERGIDNFDAWANTFGDIETKMEVTATGEYKPVSRFAKFTNIPELMSMTRQMMDVQRADRMTNPDGTPVIKRPKRKDAVNTAPKSAALESLMQDLQKRAQQLKGKRTPDKGGDNMLAICTDGRKGATDMRLLDINAEDDPDSKTNIMVRNALDIAKKNPGKTQLIFSDIGVNPTEQGFSLYGDITDKLVAGGIPRDKIADFSKLDGAKKEAAMEAMRKGEILFGIGSSEKLGTGVNVQHQLLALHHLDVPWLPSSVEQRDGRGWRQGNSNAEVQIHRYVTEGSLDQMFWQAIGNKTRFIRQVVTPGQSVQRVAADEDTEELTPEQLMAAASGDPRILEKVNLDEEVKQLKAAKTRHEREQYKLRDSLAKAERQVPEQRKHAKQLREEVNDLEARPDFSLRLGNTTLTSREGAEKAFAEHLQKNASQIADSYYDVTIGDYRGMPLVARRGKLFLLGKHNEHSVADSLRSVETVARNISKKATEAETMATAAEADLERAKQSIGKPFAKANDLEQRLQRLRKLEDELSGRDKEAEAAAQTPSEETGHAK